MLVGEVSMGRAVHVLDIAVVLGLLVGILDDKPDAGPGSLALEDTRQDADFISFTSLGCVFTGARTATIEVNLQVSFGQFQSGRAPIDHAPERRAVTLPKRGDREQRAETAAWHQFNSKKQSAIIRTRE